jgi:hypothetical protein
MESHMDKLSLPISLVNALLQYFATKPYGEVVNFVNAIQQEANAQIPQDQKDSAES